MAPLTRTDRDGHHSLTGGLSRHAPAVELVYAQRRFDVCMAVLVIGLFAYAAWKAPVPDRVPVERESGDEMRSEEP